MESRGDARDARSLGASCCSSPQSPFSSPSSPPRSTLTVPLTTSSCSLSSLDVVRSFASSLSLWFPLAEDSANNRTSSSPLASPTGSDSAVNSDPRAPNATKRRRLMPLPLLLPEVRSPFGETTAVAPTAPGAAAVTPVSWPLSQLTLDAVRALALKYEIRLCGDMLMRPGVGLPYAIAWDDAPSAGVVERTISNPRTGCNCILLNRSLVADDPTQLDNTLVHSLCQVAALAVGGTNIEGVRLAWYFWVDRARVLFPWLAYERWHAPVAERRTTQHRAIEESALSLGLPSCSHGQSRAFISACNSTTVATAACAAAASTNGRPDPSLPSAAAPLLDRPAAPLMGLGSPLAPDAACVGSSVIDRMSATAKDGNDNGNTSSSSSRNNNSHSANGKRLQHFDRDRSSADGALPPAPSAQPGPPNMHSLFGPKRGACTWPVLSLLPRTTPALMPPAQNQQRESRPARKRRRQLRSPPSPQPLLLLLPARTCRRAGYAHDKRQEPTTDESRVASGKRADDTIECAELDSQQRGAVEQRGPSSQVGAQPPTPVGCAETQLLVTVLHAGWVFASALPCLPGVSDDIALIITHSPLRIDMALDRVARTACAVALCVGRDPIQYAGHDALLRHMIDHRVAFLCQTKTRLGAVGVQDDNCAALLMPCRAPTRRGSLSAAMTLAGLAVHGAEEPLCCAKAATAHPVSAGADADPRWVLVLVIFALMPHPNKRD